MLETGVWSCFAVHKDCRSIIPDFVSMVVSCSVWLHEIKFELGSQLPIPFLYDVEYVK